MLENRNKSNGLVKKMVDENVKSEDIIRIIADFIIAAGDTVNYKKYLKHILLLVYRTIKYLFRT